VGMVKINDCFVWQGSVCPVCAQFYIGYDKILPISVNGSFRDLINCAYSDSFLLVIRKGICHIPEGLSDINSFPITWMLDILAAFPDGFQPFFFTFLSGIPFYDERHSVFSVSCLHSSMVSLRKSGVSFWQCCFQIRSSRLTRYPSVPIYAIIGAYPSKPL